MKRKFQLTESSDGKDLYIEGPMEMVLNIDFDDVDHDQVEKEAWRLIDLLQKHWKDSK